MKYSAISLSAILIQIYLFMLLLLILRDKRQKNKGNIRICVKHDAVAVNTATKDPVYYLQLHRKQHMDQVKPLYSSDNYQVCIK